MVTLWEGSPASWCDFSRRAVQPESSTQYLSRYYVTLMGKVLKWQSLGLPEHILSLQLRSFTFEAKTNDLSCI